MAHGKLEFRYTVSPYNARIVEKLCRRLAGFFQSDAGEWLLRLYSIPEIQHALVSPKNDVCTGGK